MRKLFSVLVVLTAIILASCTKDESQFSTGDSVLKVSVETTQSTKVGFNNDDNWSFFWHNLDKIWVNGSFMTTNVTTGESVADFRGFGVNTSDGYAIYPFLENVNLNSTSLTWSFPASYEYTVADADFFETAQALPMYAQVIDGSARFKHLGAIMAVKFTGCSAGEYVFTLKTSKKITGEFSTDLTGNEPVFTTDNNTADQVSIKYTNTVDNSDMVFYVPVPVGTYDVEISLNVDNIELFNKKVADKQINRGDIVNATYAESNLTAENSETKSVANVTDITSETLNTAEENLTVEISGQISGNNNITLPAGLDTKTTTFKFEDVAADAKITIVNDTDAAYDGKIIIEIHAQATLPEVVANVPDGEVYIKQGTVTKLIASSKSNTTIIGEDVTVQELEVVKGNVKVLRGGTLNNIIRSTGNMDGYTFLVYEEGANIPSVTDENIVVISVEDYDKLPKIGEISYRTVQEAVDAAQESIITLKESVIYNEIVKVTGGKKLTIQGADAVLAGIDHQSNANPSTIIVKGVTIDNSLIADGWFTGTSPNIYPCVGAWGGYFTFENCKFIVSGESKRETGIMTWWTADNLMTLEFNGCTFEGKNDHRNARAMQIYGKVDMSVNNCTFTTYKDYTIKYVAKENNKATFTGNTVCNSENFVELGSAPYAGNQYTVNIVNTTLGKGVNHYVFANYENQTVNIDNIPVALTNEQFKSIVTSNIENISVKLDKDLSLDVTAWETSAIGGDNTKIITIYGNNKTLSFNQLNSDWNNIATKNNAKLIIKDAKITNTGYNNGPWNRHDLNFACDVELYNVDSDKAIALKAGGVLNNVTICDANTSDTYAIWIQPKGQTVTIDNCTIDMLECSDGRGIKIDNQYLSASEEGKVTLNVSNTTFKTEEKGAILVKSTKGADITISNVDISQVAADTVNAVWVDSDTSSYADLVTVKGANKYQEQ